MSIAIFRTIIFAILYCFCGFLRAANEEISRRDIVISQHTFVSLLNRQVKELQSTNDVVNEILKQIPKSKGRGGKRQQNVYKRNGAVHLSLQANATLADYFRFSLDAHSVMAAKLVGERLEKYVWKRICSTKRFNEQILMTSNEYYRVEDVGQALGTAMTEGHDASVHEATVSWAHQTNSIVKLVFIPTNFTMNSIVDAAVELVDEGLSEYQLLNQVRLEIDKYLLSREQFLSEGGIVATISEVWQYFVLSYSLVLETPNPLLAALDSSTSALYSICRKGFEGDRIVHAFSITSNSDAMKQVYVKLLPIPKNSPGNVQESLGSYFAYLIHSCVPSDAAYSGSTLYDLVVVEACKKENVQSYAQQMRLGRQEIIEKTFSIEAFSMELRDCMDYTVSKLSKHVKFAETDLLYLNFSCFVMRHQNEALKFRDLPILYPKFEDKKELERYVKFVLYQTSKQQSDNFVIAFFENLTSATILKEYENVVQKAYSQFGTSRAKGCNCDAWIISFVSLGFVGIIVGYIFYIYTLKKKYPERGFLIFPCETVKQ